MKQATLPLFDRKESNRRRDEAIDSVEANADEEWKVRALEAIRKTAESHQFFQGDDVWLLIEKPREPRALGAAMRRAQSKKWIVPTNTWKPSSIPTQHSAPTRVWQSLIYAK